MTRNQREMIAAQQQKAREKLSAAKALLECCHYDDAISRAYYAVFHAASAVLLSEGITVESHQSLKTMFGLQFIKTGKIDREYGKWLSELKDERENGDYDIYTGFDRQDAAQAFKKAEQFAAEMERYLSTF